MTKESEGCLHRSPENASGKTKDKFKTPSVCVRIRTVNSRKLALAVVGVVLVLMGTVFALQGANYIGGSALMSGNSTYIYVGAVVVVIGLLALAVAYMQKAKPGAPKSAPQPSGKPS